MCFVIDRPAEGIPAARQGGAIANNQRAFQRWQAERVAVLRAVVPDFAGDDDRIAPSKRKALQCAQSDGKGGTIQRHWHHDNSRVCVWLVGRAVHVALLFPLGMLLGLGISIGYIIYRFGREQGAERPRKEITGDR